MDESEIFAAALSKDPAERGRFLDTACGEDTILRERVERLLDAHENPDSFLDRPVETLPADPGAAVSRRIGPYKLLQQIGEGGMGTVFMAEQTEPVQRRVALKVIKPGMDSREVIARFEAERQALALMDHPGIARVLDAGTTPDGRPYFVMELVHGLPITEYCDEHQLGTRARLELFASVCRAVQHAHQKGVIHRDLKPSNILVAEYDHQAVPKVIDFGVAKATTEPLTQKTLFTQFGQIIGTLDYMSPEQAKQNQLDVDTRSDIYSLGIVLYELLTGDTPVEKERLRSAAFDELLRIIREEEPPLPSRRLSGSQRLAQIAASRSVEARRLPSLVAGDLDWIALKTLAKDRAERYATAHELAEDVMRHLREEPILAGPPRRLVRFTKFVRRHRAPLAITTLALLAAVTGVVWPAVHRAREAAEILGRSWRATTALEQATLDLERAVHSTRGNDSEWATARSSRDRVMDWRNGGELEREVRVRIDEFARRFADARAERQLADQIERVVIYGATHPDLASWETMERELRELFLAHGMDLNGGDPAGIAVAIREHPRAALWIDALELWIGTRGQMASLGGPTLNAEIMQPWADAMYAADSDPVRTGIRRFIYRGWPPTRAEVDALVEGVVLEELSPRGLSWLASIYGMAGAMEETDRVYRIALRQHPDDLMLTFDHAFALAGQRRWQEATRMYMRCLGLRPDVPGIWQSMGLALREVDELANAQEALQRACDLEPDYAPAWVNLGEVLLERDRPDAALEAGEEALALDPDSAGAHGVVGRALMEEGHLDEAYDALEACHRLGQQQRGWRQPSAEWLAECRRRREAGDQEADQ